MAVAPSTHSTQSKHQQQQKQIDKQQQQLKDNLSHARLTGGHHCNTSGDWPWSWFTSFLFGEE
jgi:hypothetical protein